MFLLLKCIYSYRRTRRKRKTRPANNIWTILGCPKAGKSDPKIAKIGDFSENVKINYLLPKNGWRFGTYYLCNIKSIKYWAFRAGLQIFRQKLTIFRVFWKMELLSSLCPLIRHWEAKNQLWSKIAKNTWVWRIIKVWISKLRLFWFLNLIRWV